MQPPARQDCGVNSPNGALTALLAESAATISAGLFCWGLAKGCEMADFTVVVAGIVRETFAKVIEDVYVPEASDPVEAGRRAAASYEAETGIAVMPVYVVPGRAWPETGTMM